MSDGVERGRAINKNAPFVVQQPDRALRRRELGGVVADTHLDYTVERRCRRNLVVDGGTPRANPAGSGSGLVLVVVTLVAPELLTLLKVSETPGTGCTGTFSRRESVFRAGPQP